MGGCMSTAPAKILDTVDGDETAYHKRYLEDQVLGEGEFGVVKMVFDTSKKPGDSPPLACKVLRKGIVFKDNTLYTPLKPEVLRGEIEMLRTLRGDHFCLKLVSVFETPRLLYMITEYCAGGEMMEYVAGLGENDLRTEDVSRIASQMLSAIHHCASHGIIHRDIKPENVMFEAGSPGAAVRLIDFGSGVMDTPAPGLATALTNGTSNDLLQTHTTFAGSAFYISPEMFQRTYTSKTDVWSVGATLYVLVAGYPADSLQKAFNILQTANNRNLRNLPNLPQDMPDSYYDMLDKLLVYRHKSRPTAGRMLGHEFVKFHVELAKELQAEAQAAAAAISFEQVAATAATTTPTKEGSGRNGTLNKTKSISLRGSVTRHSMFLGFKKFERSLTTLLATMLSKSELNQFLQVLYDRMGDKIEQGQAKEEEAPKAAEVKEHQKLHVILVKEIREILLKDFKNEQIVETLDKLPNAASFGSFAYHVALLNDFTSGDGSKGGGSTNSGAAAPAGGNPRQLQRSNSSNSTKRGAALKRTMTMADFKMGRGAILTDSGGSVRSLTSLKSFKIRAKKQKDTPSTVHGGTLFAPSKPKAETPPPAPAPATPTTAPADEVFI